MRPLADKLRPKNLDEVVGQQHLIGPGRVLRKIFETGRITNMIFYGPPGVGKTTVASLMAKITDKKFYKLNATNASVKDIQNIIDELDSFLTVNGAVLYLDEIQNFNKKQQQALLEYMENGKLIVIASTTENPYQYIYDAILSRSMVFEFKSLDEKDIISGLIRTKRELEKEYSVAMDIDENAYKSLAYFCNGDMRKGINSLENILLCTMVNGKDNLSIDTKVIKEVLGEKVISFDKDGDTHYDLLSAFQKSIRGSDENAAVHYLARLIRGGDIKSICRRLMVIACEDIGMAYPNAITIVKSCVDSALMIGLPEARIPLAQATIVLATSPKSNSAYLAIESALADLEGVDFGSIPDHLKDAHYSGAKNLGRGRGYKYPHDYENNYIKQQYFPNKIKGKIYYNPQNNKMEKAISGYLEQLKSNKNQLK